MKASFTRTVNVTDFENGIFDHFDDTLTGRMRLQTIWPVKVSVDFGGQGCSDVMCKQTLNFMTDRQNGCVTHLAETVSVNEP